VTKALLALVLLLPASSPGLSGRYLLAYADCSASPCVGALAQSRNGVRWSAVAGVASAPVSGVTAVRRGSELYLYGPRTLTAAGIAGDLRRFKISGAELGELPDASNTVLLADPKDAAVASPGSFGGSVVIDGSGALALVYGIRLEPGTNSCPTAGSACLKVRSATEVAGSDGTVFQGDPGNRLVVSFAADDTVGAPSVFAGPKGAVLLLAGPGGCVRAATAKDVHSAFSALGPCLAQGVDSPSGFWNARLNEFWLYGESGGHVVRAVATKLAGTLRFRPLAVTASAPSFAPNAP
jgi:hypothetical protein